MKYDPFDSQIALHADGTVTWNNAVATVHQTSEVLEGKPWSDGRTVFKVTNQSESTTLNGVWQYRQKEAE